MRDSDLKFEIRDRTRVTLFTYPYKLLNLYDIYLAYHFSGKESQQYILFDRKMNDYLSFTIAVL